MGLSGTYPCLAKVKETTGTFKILASKCPSQLSPCLLSWLQVRIRNNQSQSHTDVESCPGLPQPGNLGVSDRAFITFFGEASKPFFEFIPASSTHSTLLLQVLQCPSVQGEEPPPSTHLPWKCHLLFTLIFLLPGSWGVDTDRRSLFPTASWYAAHGFIDLNNIPAPGQTHLLQSLQSHSPEEAFSHQALQANTKIQKLICYWQNKWGETRTQLFLQLQYPHKHILLCSCMGKWALQPLRSNKSERANCSLSGFILQLRQKK